MREREPRGGVVSLDVCSNLVGLGGKDIGTGMTLHQQRDTGGTKTDNHNNPPNHNPPKILPVSGKLEQVCSFSQTIMFVARVMWLIGIVS